MLKIDMHAHILPQDWPDFSEGGTVPGIPYLERRDGRTIIMRDGKFFREIWANAWDIESRIEELATHDVDVQVLSTVPVMFCYHAPAATAVRLHRFLNDDIAEQQRRYPKQVVSLGTVPMQDADIAIAELRRIKEELGLPGFQIGSHIDGGNLSNPQVFPIFEAARDLGLCVLVHPWDMMGKETMPKYWLPWLVGMPAEMSRAICSLIFGGVMERLPELRFCFAHGGGSFPFTIGRIEHGFKMRPDLVAVDNDRSPREYIGKFWVDSVTHDPVALRYLVDVLGASSIVLGTDYPFPLGEQEPGSVIEQLDLSEADRNGMFFENALRWLNLDQDRFL